jgi:HTH-type transcriptional regulator/antitoxin HipB
MIAKNPRDVGLLMREQRRKLGLDQIELARRAGVSRQWVIEVEKGKARAEIGLVLRALGVLGLAVDVSESARASRGSAASARMDLDAVIERARAFGGVLPRATTQPRTGKSSSKLAGAREKAKRR